MRSTYKKWVLNKKQFLQNFNGFNDSYKLNANFMVTFNGFMVIEGDAYEMYDATQNVTILVTKHGVVNIEKNKGDWQMYRR